MHVYVTPERRVELGRRIRAARETKGLSQAETAREAGIPGHSLWRYEDGRVAPDLENLAKVARVLSVTIESLLDDAPQDPNAPHDTIRSTVDAHPSVAAAKGAA